MQQNPYDFIMQSTPQPKKGMFGGSSRKNRILRVLIVGGVVLVSVLLIFSFVSKIGKANVENLYKIAAAQEDLIVITDQYARGANTSSVSTKAATLNIMLVSQNQETMSAIYKTGIKKPAQQIAAYKVTSYKKVLDDAKTKGTYAEAYDTLLANRIDDYRVKLNAAYSSSKEGAFKNRLANFYQQLNIIAPQPVKETTATPTPTPSNN